MSITVNVSDIKLLERDLEKLRRKALPFATNQMLNQTAKKATGIARSKVQRDMILRNRGILKTILFVKSKTLRISDQHSTVGSLLSALEKQEFGEVKTATGSVGVPIPTPEASKQGSSYKRTKAISGVFKLNSIRLRHNKIKARTKTQENVIKVKEAIKRGKRVVYMDTGRKQGIYRIKGSAKNPNPRMLYDMSERRVVTPPSPWLRPSMLFAGKFMQGEYARALRFQIQRARLFDGR